MGYCDDVTVSVKLANICYMSVFKLGEGVPLIFDSVIRVLVNSTTHVIPTLRGFFSISSTIQCTKFSNTGNETVTWSHDLD